MASSRDKFDDLVIKAKQVGYIQEMLSSDEIMEEGGLGMTDEEFYDLQEQHINLISAIKDGARTIYPEVLFAYADERRAQLQGLREDENADLVDIDNEERAIDMVVGFWQTPASEDTTPTE